MYSLRTLLITVTLCFEFGENYPQGITLDYKPNRPFYAMGWTNRPSQIHGPGTPWPASAEGYTKTTTGRPWWATSAPEDIAANAVSISSEAPALPPSTTPTTTTTTTTPAPPPPPPPSTTLANRIDIGSTIATKKPPVQASTEGTLFTSAPETGSGSAGPQGPPKQGAWSRPPKPTSASPVNLPPRASSTSSERSVATAESSSVPPPSFPGFPEPNNLTLMAEPLNHPDPTEFSSAAPPPTSTISSSASTPPPKSASTASTTVNVDRNSGSAVDLNSRFSRPESLIEVESEEGDQERAWVWSTQEEDDGKMSSGEFYDTSATSLDFK